jgi:hypothetical protein
VTNSSANHIARARVWCSIFSLTDSGQIYSLQPRKWLPFLWLEGEVLNFRGGNGSAKDSALGNTPRLCAQSCRV